MGYFNGILRSQTQKANQEEEAIQTLSNRLQHATLSSDRKSAVLGLKSFSRQFRESVIQYGLRALLQTLAKDHDNAQLVKAVLETLLVLFLRGGDSSEDQTLGWISNQSRAQNGKYPSPLLVEQIEIDEFSNWIADEMISTEDHVKCLTGILSNHTGFQIRLYSLQLLEAVVATRPTRAKECLINIPLAVPIIVGLLDDPNDPIRNEAILLLMALVNNNFNIQKLVAFENTFEKIFEIIEEEGGIRGSILVQDCMTLLTNLLMYNASNQIFFLETDCVPKLANLIAEPIEGLAQNGLHDDYGNAIPAPPIVWTEQRIQNMSIALEICKSFVDPDNQHLTQNQNKLFSSGIFFSILRLVFSPVMENMIRKTALQVTGDIVANNSQLQLQFAQIDVPYVDPSLPLQVQNFDTPIPAPLALLNWALLINSVHIFEIRLTAMYCLVCFFKGNDESKMAFLNDQIEASKNPTYFEELQTIAAAEANKEETERSSDAKAESSQDLLNQKKTPFANIFTKLTVYDSEIKLNPYSVWFSAVVLVHLIQDSPETREMARRMKVGEQEEGEEEMSSLQAIANMLIANLENSDPRIATGYLTLLTIWLFEDFNAVNDFLSDSSIIRAILSFLSKNSTSSSEIVHGMCAILVGVCYDFSTKSSPMARENLYELVTKGLGIDNYVLKIKQLKNNPIFKHFDGDLDTDFERDSSGLPILFFIPEYVELVKDNFYRIRRSLFRGPELEPRSKISFEVFEELENKNLELNEALKDLNEISQANEKKLQEKIKNIEAELQENSNLLETSRSDAEKAKESESQLVAKIELLSSNIKTLEAEKSKFESSSDFYTKEFNRVSKILSGNEESIKQIRHKLSETEESKRKAEDGINKMNRELFQLTKEKKEADAKIANYEKELNTQKTQLEAKLKGCHDELETARKINSDLRAKINTLESNGLSLSPNETENHSHRLRELQNQVSEKEEENDTLMEKLRSAAQMVHGLKNDKATLVSEKEDLESELEKAYEDLEAFSKLLDEVKVLKAQREEKSRDPESVTDLENISIEARAAVESKDKIASDLAEALETVEKLQLTLSDERLRFENEMRELKKSYEGSDIFPKETSSTGEKSGVQVNENDEESNVGALESELKNLNQKLIETQELHESEISRYKKELESLKEQHSSLLVQYRLLSDEVSQHLEAERMDVETQKSSHSPDLDEKNKELESCSKRIKDLERNIEVLSESASSSLASFKASQATLKYRIAELEEEKGQMSEEIEHIRSEYEKSLTEYNQAFEELENSNVDMELMITTLEKKKEELEKQLQKQSDDSSKRIAQLSKEVEDLKIQLTNTKEEKEKIHRDYIELEKSSNIIGSELQAKEALLQALNNKGADLAVKDKIVNEIKDKLSSTIAELAETAQNLRILSKEKSDLHSLHEQNLNVLEETKACIVKLEKENSEKDLALDNLRTENRKLLALQDNYAELSKANESNVEKVTSLEEQLSRTKASLQEVTQNLERQRKLNFENSEAAVSEYTEKTVKLEKSILVNQQAYDAALEELEVKHNAELETLRNELESLKIEKDELSAKLASSKYPSTDFESRLNDLEKTISELNLEIKNLNDAKQAREIELTGKVQELEQRDREACQLQAELQKQKEELQAANLKNSELSKQIDELRTEKEKSELEMDSKEEENLSENSGDNRSIGSDSKKNEEASNALEKKDTDMEELRKENTSQRKQLDLFKEKLMVMEHALEDKARELDETHSQLTEALNSVQNYTKAEEQVTTETNDTASMNWKNLLEEEKQASLNKEKKVKQLEFELQSIKEKYDTEVALQEANSELGLENKQLLDQEIISRKKAQEDFADLMLMCEEQEKKILKYKSIMRAVDLSVSSDDDDEKEAEGTTLQEEEKEEKEEEEEEDSLL